MPKIFNRDALKFNPMKIIQCQKLFNEKYLLRILKYKFE